MVPNKLDPKYYLPIWIGLFFSTLVCNFYDFYSTCAALVALRGELARIDVTMYVIEMLFGDIIVPALLCVLFAFIVYQMGFSRYVRSISRKDFMYFVMLFISASRLIMGFVNIFGLLNEDVVYCTTGFLSTLCNASAMLVMFFVVFKRLYRFNPAEEYNAYRSWATMFMIGGGIKALLGNGAVLILMDTPELLSVLEIDYASVNLPVLSAGCITGMVLYAAYLAAIIAIGVSLKKKSRRFLDPATRGAYYDSRSDTPYTVRTDASDVFGDCSSTDDSKRDGGDKDDKVFEEFDI